MSLLTHLQALHAFVAPRPYLGACAVPDPALLLRLSKEGRTASMGVLCCFYWKSLVNPCVFLGLPPADLPTFRPLVEKAVEALADMLLVRRSTLEDALELCAFGAEYPALRTQFQELEKELNTDLPAARARLEDMTYFGLVDDIIREISTLVKE